MSFFYKFLLIFTAVLYVTFSDQTIAEERGLYIFEPPDSGYTGPAERAEREISPKEAYRLSKDVVHDMFIEPGKYAPVFRELLRSDDLYEEMCHELERDTELITDKQYFRWDHCREYFKHFYEVDLSELRN